MDPHLLALTNALLADRTSRFGSGLALQNIALRQQIALLKRSVKRANTVNSARVFWILLPQPIDGWRDALLIVKPGGLHHRYTPAA